MEVALDLKKSIVGKSLGNWLRPSMGIELNPAMSAPAISTGMPDISWCFASICPHSD